MVLCTVVYSAPPVLAIVSTSTAIAVVAADDRYSDTYPVIMPFSFIYKQGRSESGDSASCIAISLGTSTT